MEPRLRASPEQFSIIIEFMERYGDLSKPQPGPQGRIRSDLLWEKLTNILNSSGGGVQKTPLKWKKVWADWKTKTKKKYLSLRLQATGTGGGPNSRTRLTALEERVVAVIGVHAVVGQAGILEQGLNRISSEPAVSTDEITLDVMLEDDSQNIEVASQTPAISGPRRIQPQHLIPNIIVATAASPVSPPSPRPTLPLPISPPLPLSSVSPPPPLPATPLPPTPPPPRPRTPVRRNRRQASASPRSTAATPRRALLRARRNRGLTPFEQASEKFSAVEQHRLEIEEARDRHLHEREMERLRLEAERLKLDAQRVDVAREHNLLIHQLIRLGNHLIDVLNQQRPGSLPSTDPI